MHYLFNLAWYKEIGFNFTPVLDIFYRNIIKVNILILYKTNLILTKERIHFTKSQIAQISYKTVKFHLFLSATLRHNIWQILDY